MKMQQNTPRLIVSLYIPSGNLISSILDIALGEFYFYSLSGLPYSRKALIAALVPTIQLLVVICARSTCCLVTVKLRSTCSTTLAALFTPRFTSFCRSPKSDPVNLIASRVAGSSRLRVSNNFSALRAALASSCTTGIATTNTAVKLMATNNNEQPSQKTGSVILRTDEF